MALLVELPSLVKPRIALKIVGTASIFPKASSVQDVVPTGRFCSSKNCRMQSKKKTQGRQTPSALQAAQLAESIRKEER